MRPVRLEMDGFASFRSHTVIDFEGADYFALTGPTGSGKSTVIDGIVFALYGTAPRWGGANVVRYALAPTVQRAIVRLVFDLGPDRYQVAREVRRSGAQLSQKSVSLERILDPASEDSEVEVLASDGPGVTLAVQKLLGISLEEFCKAVVLPQGQFAEFLTATPAVRQEILLKLLGSQVYEQVRGAAVEREQVAKERVVAHDALLQELAGATIETVAAARERRQKLTALYEGVQARLVALAAARDRAETTASDLAASLRRRDLLGRVEVPKGVGEFGERATRVQTALSAARASEELAGRAYDDARTALDAAGDRSELERLQGWWVQRTELERNLPVLAEEAAVAAAAADTAELLASDAQEAWQAAKDELGAAQGCIESAQTVHDQLRLRRDTLAAVVKPSGLDDLAARVSRANRFLEEAEAAVQRAEAEDVMARQEAATAGTDAPLLRQLELLDRWSPLQAEIDRIRALIQTGARELERLQSDRELAESAATAAERALRSARDRHSAAELRNQLALGDECPVCTQRVVIIPPALDAAEVDRVEAELFAANSSLKDAQRQLAKAEAEAGTTASTLTTLLAQSTELRVELGATDGELDAPALRAGLEDRISVVRPARTRLEEAGATLLAARGEREAASREGQDISEEASRARARLRAAREELLPFGAPAVDETALGAGWAALLGWADSEIASLDETGLVTSLEHVQTATATVVAAQTRLEERSHARANAQAELKTALELAARTQTSHEQAQASQRTLTERLADAPPRASVEAQLAELQRLAGIERTAYLDRQAAHVAVEAAQQQHAAFEAERDAAVEAFRALRTQLAPLGAPTTDEADLAAAWHRLTVWAATATAGADAAVTAAEAAHAAADAAVSDEETQLLAITAAGGVVCSAADHAGEDVAGELGRAQHALELLEEQVERREGVLVQRREAVRTRQVAELLGSHLRANRFPRWLAGAALDVLVAAASDSLLELSGGQFSLTHDDKEFAVIDHADAEAQRSVRTLSGGETFQASLSLALALSGEFSGLSSAASSLDSIFLDEGFGTLDVDCLEIVAATLERLAQGDRMVGVVTHVASLAERVPTRFLVSRNSKTSTVVREG